MRIKNIVLVRDALQNLATDSGATDEYAKGVTLGVVSGIMATKGCGFDVAWELVKNNLPKNVREKYAPEEWLK